MNDHEGISELTVETLIEIDSETRKRTSLKAELVEAKA
jgi:hypothetical protein